MPQEVALVTGAGSGIGAAVALRLGERGAHVIAVDRAAEGLAQLAQQLGEKGITYATYATDVTDDAGWAHVIEDQSWNYGPLSTVVACAGIATRGEVTTLSLDDWNRTISVNLTGTALTARHTVPLLLASGRGTFTAISSDAGVLGAQGYAAYCASKHAVVGLIRCMALDYGPRGIRSNVICPGFVRTQMSDDLLSDISADEQQMWETNVPLGRFAEPHEVAATVAHLSSDDASYANGVVHMLDGGASAGAFVPL